ncbi:cyclin-P4-1-like protein [Carex littledalei]|uniref:Cyclin-P4-1-like protein n=1 Tax=Carex littledalei TaxID=544730 RepID=A0A833VWX5_9POAL|nr:cyclin-P4-1-like protein [Carex littledalei]
MNSLELEFLFGMQFELNVSPNQFNSYCTMLEAEMCMESISSIPKLHSSSLQEKHEGDNTTEISLQFNCKDKN